MGSPIVFVSCVTAGPHDMRIGARKYPVTSNFHSALGSAATTGDGSAGDVTRPPTCGVSGDNDSPGPLPVFFFSAACVPVSDADVVGAGSSTGVGGAAGSAPRRRRHEQKAPDRQFGVMARTVRAPAPSSNFVLFRWSVGVPRACSSLEANLERNKADPPPVAPVGPVDIGARRCHAAARRGDDTAGRQAAGSNMLWNGTFDTPPACPGAWRSIHRATARPPPTKASCA
jgi:hypothetical protein